MTCDELVATSSTNENHVNGCQEQQKLTVLSKGEASFQKKLINESTNVALRKGDKWFVVGNYWYKQWERYIECVLEDRDAISNYPGAIDNGPLFEQRTYKLKENLHDVDDYILISEEGWNEWVKTYGIVDSQEPIERYVITHGLQEEPIVEVYLTELKLNLYGDKKDITKSYSKVTKICDVIRDMKTLYDIPQDEEVRVWNQFIQGNYELLTKLDHTLEEASISSGQVLSLETKVNNEWCRQTRSRSLSSSSSHNISANESGDASGLSNSFGTPTNSYLSRSYSHSHSQTGLCGLSNLGNTCFMNAALQCLSNTKLLTKYFMANTHKHELNTTNPLGMKGKVAEAYGELVHNIWSGHNSYITPRQFKMIVGRFAPQFSGYQQQDSQELLAFLLDGLHEDLNRVKQKPYVELKDDNGRPDEEVAAEAWKNHKMRNDSVIVDLFHGQFKSTVQCPECNKKSVTFDPFCYLSLPLPIKKERNITLVFVPIDYSKIPIKMKVTVPKGGFARDLKNEVAKLTNADPSKLMVCDLFGSKIHKKIYNNEMLSHITDRDTIYVYETDVESSISDKSEKVALPVYFREIRQQSTYSYGSTGLFGEPMYITFPKRSLTADEIYHVILDAMKRFVTPSKRSKPKADIKEEAMENGDVTEESSQNVDEEMPEENGEQINGDLDDSDEEKIKNDSSEKECSNYSKEEKANEPYYLFDVCITNSYSTHDIKNLEYDNDEEYDLTGNMYLAINWYPKIKKKHYNSKQAELFRKHESLQYVPPSKNDIQLQDCLQLFLQREKLGEEDPWYCPVCKEHRQAYKKFDLWTLPKVLIIHLKRFSHNRYWRDKLDVLVNFPLRNLDLTDHVLNKKHGRVVYDLHGVSNHYGGLGGGHYTAYAINCLDMQWHYFDDSSVSSADASSVVSKAAYVLFYSRRDDPDSEPIDDVVSEDVFTGSDEDEPMN